MIKEGQDIHLRASGRTATVERFIGEGGQGSVYEVSVDDAPAALKWYFPHTGTEQQKVAIANLVRRPAPNSRFLWPSEMVEIDGHPAFGYLMPLRPPNHISLAKLLKGKVDVRSLVRTTLCRDLAHSFLNLHSQGLCYRDISFANIFLDPTTGHALICDNDNVAIDDGTPAPVLGTRKFMAPEIVRGEAEPSTFTDLWSLSVLLFYILVVGHPLIGKRELRFESWDEEFELEMFGRDPLFVFDPHDDSNRPDPSLHGPMSANWRTLTDYVRTLFEKAFTVGIHEPKNGRVGESMWQKAMALLQDSVVLCRRCGAENFFDPTAPGASCWACATAIGSPMRLIFDHGRWVAISDQTRIWDHHLSSIPNYEFESPVAEVTRHPDRTDVWGLRNVGEATWTVTPPDGDPIPVEPGRSFGLVPGSVFKFGSRMARLEA